MTQLQLLTGAYETRSIIAGAQRCVNLFGEVQHFETFAYFPQPTGPSMTTHYPTPGLVQMFGGSGSVRCLYAASNGQLFAVIGQTVYYLPPDFAGVALGTIDAGTSIVSMADNGSTVVIVDGTVNGYTFTLNGPAATPGNVTALVDPTGLFVGANTVVFVNTYFVFNAPGTPQMYCSLSNSTTFDALYFADKVGYADNIQGIAAVQQQLWLIGTRSTEIWYDSGQADFPFQQVSGAFIYHGTPSAATIAVFDSNVFFLSRDNAGHGIVFMGSGNYQTQRISTHAIEYQIQQYSTIEDAIGFIYQHQGHVFYVLTFPSGDATWVYDMATKLWHEWLSADSDGNLHRHRVQCAAYAYGMVVGGDWENGIVYRISQSAYTDNGTPIQRIRSFPHLVQDLKRVRYSRFVADIECGLGNPAADTTLGDAPTIYLRLSDDRGRTFSNPIPSTMGALGQYRTIAQWRRLGVARDRIFEVFWSSPVETAMNGAFLDGEPLAS